jgi:CRISPR/Cas system-associated endonuclease Cas1
LITKRSARIAANVLTCNARICTMVVLLSGCRATSAKPRLVRLENNNKRRLKLLQKLLERSFKLLQSFLRSSKRRSAVWSERDLRRSATARGLAS